MRGPNIRWAAISLARVQHGVEIAAHVANAGDAVGDEERKDEVGRRSRCGPVEVDMGVHVPEAGDEVLALGVDDLSSFGIELGGGSNGGDSVAVNDYGELGWVLPVTVSMTVT